jgi:ribosomal protein S18 acetylase RimI-like enzyme
MPVRGSRSNRGHFALVGHSLRRRRHGAIPRHAGQWRQRYPIDIGGAEAGVISVRYPWLKGPYLELLAIFPEFQGRGLGTRVLAWMEQEAIRHEARNLWVCASSFNDSALRLYERNGFRQVARLRGLVEDSCDEILLRKYPLGGSPRAAPS